MPCLRTYTPDPEASKYTIYVEGFMDSNTYLKNSNARLLIEIKIKCITIIIYIIFFKNIQWSRKEDLFSHVWR